MSRRPLTRSVRKKRVGNDLPCSTQTSGLSDEEISLSGREEAMKKYMNVALKKRKKTVTSSKSTALDDYFMISVGRMTFDRKSQRGILDKSFAMKKVPMLKESSYSQVLNLCINNVWENASEEDCYLADGSGSKISGDNITLNLKEGGNMTLAWNLSHYIKLCGSYPSRVRLYCVKLDMESCRKEPTNETVISETQGSKGKRISMKQQSTSTPATNSSSTPIGYFDVGFLQRKYSRYSDKAVFMTLTQERILCNDIEDHGRMHEVEDSLFDNPHFRIFSENPLHLGFFLDSITPDQQEKMEFIDIDSESGEINLKKPVKNSNFDIWTGCYASPTDQLAIMCTIALNGFHGVATYSWESDDVILVGEDTPLLYSGIGKYKCTVEARVMTMSAEFEVYENNGVHVRVLKPCNSEKDKDTESLTPPGLQKDDLQFIQRNEIEALTTQLGLKSINEVHIIEEIGQGAFGEVYKAVWRGTIVAVKQIKAAGNKQMLENEILAYQSLHHPNILNLLGTITKPHSIMLITNYVRGGSLHSMVFEKQIELSMIEKLNISTQLCQALVYMHSANPPIAHLDVKPENVLIEEGTLHVYLGDFGLGKIITGTRVFGLSTMQSGTPGFQSPEQLRGEDLGVQSDIYAYGAVLTELFGMKPIWDNKHTSHTIIYKVATLAQFPCFDHLPGIIQNIVKLCLCPIECRASASTILKALCDIYLQNSV